MEDQKAQLAKRITESSYVLVTVNANPTFDQLAAAIGLTLMLNKMNKYATAIFSGKVPASLNFLNPERTIERTTDSLRDFIISLDKNKADKLRYKIEDNFVKIFISPYHSAITENDLVYSMGDYNVDVVIGLGVVKREEMDNIITEHGRILHDATVTTVNTVGISSLGTINWNNPQASSLCEMLVSLAESLKSDNLVDEQIANALLSGIVEETSQFSNSKTTADTMHAGSKLLSFGANQQLVSKEVLSGNLPSPQPQAAELPKPDTDEGALTIEHPEEPTPTFEPEVVPKDSQVIDDVPNTLSRNDMPYTKTPTPTPSKEHQPIDDNKSNAGVSSGHDYLEDSDNLDIKGLSGEDDDDDVPASPLENTPIMEHKSSVMGQKPTSSPDAYPLMNRSNDMRKSLEPIEALNAQPVDLTQRDTTVEVPELSHQKKPQDDIDVGIGTNIEFSDPSSPPPDLPPPITKPPGSH
ncbi:MAG TPA: hypothetical protein VMR76_02550 [Candidatus Saccharimonadia bacterium]|nr:hypothetical protein [Candidatus Saccharimonadia bacterium]